MATTRRQRFAGIELPEVDDPSLAAFMQAVKDRLEQSSGDRGKPMQRFVTMQDLHGAGIANVQIKGKYAVIKSGAAGIAAAIGNSSAGTSANILDAFANASVPDEADLPGNNQYILYDPVARTIRRVPIATLAFSTEADYEVNGNWTFGGNLWLQGALILGNDVGDATEGYGTAGDIPMNMPDPTLVSPGPTDLVTRWHTPGDITKVDDTNVTLTLGGTPVAAVLEAVSFTLGWTGQLGVTRGGTSFGSYTAGDLIYATGASALAKLGIGTAADLLTVSGGAPAWIARSVLFANPSASFGVNLAGANGSANTALRSDAVLKLDESIAPTWTGVHLFDNLVRLKGYTVATLPAGSVGMRAYVTDATAPTYLGALVGLGAVVCPVFHNGTAWVSA